MKTRKSAWNSSVGLREALSANPWVLKKIAARYGVFDNYIYIEGDEKELLRRTMFLLTTRRRIKEAARFAQNYIDGGQSDD
jgi:hypothetical protein